MKIHITIAGFLLALAVVLGAFGAHALEEVLTPERMKTWETAVFYHTWNALGVILIGLVSNVFSINMKRTADSILLGIFIFSGSLYALCITNIGWLGAITPIGGVLMIVGWTYFGILLVKKTPIN